MVQSDVPPDALPNLRAWAKRRAQKVTVFDLETTTNIPRVEWMGIIEVGLMTISPDGVIETLSALVYPERNIPQVVRELTGIQNEDVKGQPTWAAWAERLDQYARDHVMVGYNSSGFDCIVVIGQNARYGIENTEFQYSLDAMDLPGVRGKLIETGRRLGITSDTYHRALADVWLTAQIVDKIAEMQRLEVLDTVVGRVKRQSQSGRPVGESGSSIRAVKEKTMARAPHGRNLFALEQARIESTLQEANGQLLQQQTALLEEFERMPESLETREQVDDAKNFYQTVQDALKEATTARLSDGRPFSDATKTVREFFKRIENPLKATLVGLKERITLAFKRQQRAADEEEVVDEPVISGPKGPVVTKVESQPSGIQLEWVAVSFDRMTLDLEQLRPHLTDTAILTACKKHLDGHGANKLLGVVYEQVAVIE